MSSTTLRLRSEGTHRSRSKPLPVSTSGAKHRRGKKDDDSIDLDDVLNFESNANDTSRSSHALPNQDDDDHQSLFTKSTLQTNRTSNLDGLLSDLLDDGGAEDQNDTHSTAESTALSSLVPIVTSGQIRATAPRVYQDGGDGAGQKKDVLDGIVESYDAVVARRSSSVADDEGEATAWEDGNNEQDDSQSRSSSSQRRQQDVNEDPYHNNEYIHAPSSHLQEAHHEEDFDDAESRHTKPNEIYIYPTTSNHGVSSSSARHYHRHTDSGNTFSQRRSRQTPQSNSDSSYAMHSTGVSTILETMGLGNKHSSRGFANSIASSSKRKNTKVEKMHATRQNRMLHLRATFLMLALVGMMYASVQLTAVVKHDRMALTSLRHRNDPKERYARNRGNVHEEGVDRPVGDWEKVLGRRARDPNAVAKQLVKGKIPQGDSFRDGGVGRGGTKRMYVEDADEMGDDAFSGGKNNARQMIQTPNRVVGSGMNKVTAVDSSNHKVLSNNDAPVDILPPANKAPVPAKVPKKQQPQQQKVPKKQQPQQQQQTVPKNERATQNDIDTFMSQTLPPTIQYLADINALDAQHDDTPIFWHVPRSGGGLVKDVLTSCLGKIVASEAGKGQRGEGKELKVVTVNESKFLNVDVSTSAGIDRAKGLGLVPSHMADAIVTPNVLKATELFGPENKGRAFTMIRNPVDRAASMYFHLKKSGNSNVQKLTIEEYARSPLAENNWMVRFLSGKLDGEVTTEHLAVAKEVLRTKFVVGLLDYKDGSLRRFEQYFGWSYTANPDKQYQCRRQVVEGMNTARKGVKRDTQAWSLLLWQNRLDMKLYRYAEHLFAQQGNDIFAALTPAGATA